MTFDPAWEAIHAQREWGLVPSEHLARFIARTYPIFRIGTRALELGCGAGAQSLFLRREGFDVRAVDGSQSAITRVNKRAEAENLSGPYFGAQVADVCALPWLKPCFDLVVDIACLQHLTSEQVPMALIEATRVMKPGARLFSITAAWGSSASPDVRHMRRAYRRDVFALYRRFFDDVSIDVTATSDGNRLHKSWIVRAVKR